MVVLSICSDLLEKHGKCDLEYYYEISLKSFVILLSYLNSWFRWHGSLRIGKPQTAKAFIFLLSKLEVSGLGGVKPQFESRNWNWFAITLCLIHWWSFRPNQETKIGLPPCANGPWRRLAQSAWKISHSHVSRVDGTQLMNSKLLSTHCASSHPKMCICSCGSTIQLSDQQHKLGML